MTFTIWNVTIFENEPFMSNRRFKIGGQVAKRLFLAKSVQIEGKKTVFSALFFRETAVQFQIKYDELQNPKTCKQHYGGCFWSNKVGKLWIFMFGAIFGEIRTWWARTRHFRTSFELLLDTKPCFFAFAPSNKAFANISGSFQEIFKHFRRSPWKLPILFLVKLCCDLPE